MSMTGRDDRAIWLDFAHSIEVIAASELSREDVACKRAASRQGQEWADFAHSSEVLLASALGDEDAQVARAGTARRQGSAKLGGVKAGVLVACVLLVVLSYLVRIPDHQQHIVVAPARLAMHAKSLKLVNASASSSIVRVQMAAPSAGLTKVIELNDPIRPASVRQFWHRPTTVRNADRICVVYFSVGYANGASAEFPNLNLCEDTQILARETPEPVNTLRGPAASRPSPVSNADASINVMFDALELRADPTRRQVSAMRTSTDGSKMATVGDDGQVQLWETVSGRLISSLPEVGTIAAVFSPDGRQLVTLARGDAPRLWDTRTGQELFKIGRGASNLSYAAAQDHVIARDVPLLIEPGQNMRGRHELSEPDRLPAGTPINVAEIYGAWALVQHVHQLGFVPTDAIIKTPTHLAPPAVTFDVHRMDAGLNALSSKIDELVGLARYDKAMELAQTYADAVRLRFGPDRLEYAAALDRTAQLAQLSNRLDEAESFYRRALQIKQTSLGKCHPDVKSSLNNLALLYHAQGHRDPADELQREDFAMCPQ
jgi:hypothetical protein